MIKNGEKSITTIRSMKRFYTILILYFTFLNGCYPQPLEDTARYEIEFQSANILSATKSCENDQWKFTVEADAWTGNGFVIMATDARFERHPLSSFEAAEDGSSDKLRVFLSIIPDWQDFSAGSSTGWLCSDEETLSVTVAVQHALDGNVTDCIYWGDSLWTNFSTIDECDAWE